MIYFTSDTHFWHKRIIRYCNRPAANVVEMNELLIERWNERVRPTDEIYVLGDFAFAGKSKIREICKLLNGIKYLIRGNHDAYSSDFWTGECGFQWAKDYYKLKVHDVVEVDDFPPRFQQFHQPIILMHFPILSWDNMAHGVWHLHGHCHGSLPNPQNLKRMDIGVDTNNLYPWNYEEIKEIMSARVFQPVDHHGL